MANGSKVSEGENFEDLPTIHHCFILPFNTLIQTDCTIIGKECA